MNRKQRALKRFVEEIYEVYKLMTKRHKLAMISNPSPKEIGDEGEMAVKTYLESQRYTSEFSPESRTPADIYGFKLYGEFVHIVAVQVKSTISSDRAKSLSLREKSKLEKLPEFILEIYDKSRHANVINAFNMPIVITADFAEVINEEIYDITRISALQNSDLKTGYINKTLKGYYSLT